MKEKILLVDDDENLLQALTRHLRKHFDVVTATDAVRALEILDENPDFPVIVADLNMPGMDGIDFFIKAKEHHPNVIRIMLSGNIDFTQSVRAVNEGNVYRFLSKPFPAKKLVQVLGNAVDQYKLNVAISNQLALQKQLGQTISTCSYCNRIKDTDPLDEDKMIWERFELYLSRKFGFRFSHCVCPDCVKKLYEELENMREFS